MKPKRQLSKRERLLAIVVGLAAGLYLLNLAVIEPAMTSRARLTSDLEKLRRVKADASLLLSKSRAADRAMLKLQKAGLGGDASEAEGRALEALRQWIGDSGLRLESIRPDRAVASMGVRELVLQVTAYGSMRSITALLYRIETAQVPLRVREFQVTSRTENTDDLALTLRVSTIWEEAPKSATASVASATAREATP